MSSTFQYTARRHDGEFVAGSMQAESYDHALAHLRNRELFVTTLEAAETFKGGVVTAISGFPAGNASRVALFRSLSTLVAAGVPLRRSLSVVTEQCSSRRLREALRSVSSDIETGRNLSDALARRPREFPSLYVAMIRAGEASGSLEEILERIAQLLERERALKKRLASALAYPGIVAITAVALVLFLVGSTVPAFADMFVQMHVALPFSTRVLIAAGNMMKRGSFWLSLAVVCVGLGAAIASAGRNERVADALDRFRLALPVVGSLLRKITVARIARTLGSLLRSGVPILASLEAVEDVTESRSYEEAVRALCTALRRGESVSGALEGSTIFDPIFLQLVRVGEESGALDAMLLRVAGYYEADIEMAVATIGSIVEPVMIVVLGAIVGTIVGSILIPLYSIIGSIK